MALLTLTQHKAFAGITDVNPVRDASLQEIIDEAIDAVKQYCCNGEIEATEYTQIIDSPPYASFVLPYAPVIYDPDAAEPITFQLWRRSTANGDPSAFTSDDLLEMYRDYVLQPSPGPNTTTFETGIVRFLNVAGVFGYERPLYSLSVKPVPVRGAIKVTYTAGYQPTPPSLKSALNLIVRKIFHARKLGVPVTSESLNGYSYSVQGNATAAGIILGDPTLSSLLRPFCRPQIGGYY